MLWDIYQLTNLISVGKKTFNEKNDDMCITHLHVYYFSQIKISLTN